ncbi:Fungal specific transcription factor domain [Geosmithia morbida]|uniref:Fungal specific transcription factor domain n=1 Tax=Geosmithia morbida TaxID=1094350 RepID=A0A9P5D402_9HYPO|nr:Fungal specific transcription factor domain [Geosmithia morbida]KAF4122315.1 Fungal specific transcription factor domain [Geosmithia morbida]
MVQEAFALQGLLTHVLRDTGLDGDDGDDEIRPVAGDAGTLTCQRRSWVERETTRRTKLIAFTFLHTHSLAYDAYPVLRSNEVNLRLPCSTKEWKASTPWQWRAATDDVPKQQLYLQEALPLFLKNESPSAAPLDPIPTPLGNYVLLQGPYRQLDTGDPRLIARSLATAPDVQRGDGIIAALLYATHMLGIPVRLGVDRVARSQALFRSNLKLDPCYASAATAPTDLVHPTNLGLAVMDIWAHFFKSNTQRPFINIIGNSLQGCRDILVRQAAR